MYREEGTGLVLSGTGKLLAASVSIVKIKQVSLNCSKTIFQLRLIFTSDVVQRDHSGRKTHPWKSLELGKETCLQLLKNIQHCQLTNKPLTAAQVGAMAYVALELSSASKGVLAKLL